MSYALRGKLAKTCRKLVMADKNKKFLQKHTSRNYNVRSFIGGDKRKASERNGLKKMRRIPTQPKELSSFFSDINIPNKLTKVASVNKLFVDKASTLLGTRLTMHESFSRNQT